MRDETRQSYHQRVLRVLVHIQRHLDEAITLDELAAVANFSPYHFHRVFRGMVGESVKEHIRRLRLERAAHRLKHSDEPVTQVAFQAGYETHEAFTRAFHSAFGESPSAFRKTHRSAPGVASPSRVHYDPNGRVDDFEPQQGPEDRRVRVETLSAMRLAFVRHVGPYDQAGKAWDTLLAWAKARGLAGAFAKMIGVCHDDADVTPPEKTRYDACVIVGPNVKAEADVGIQHVDQSQYAAVTHRGPYRLLGDTYAVLCGQGIPAIGREPASAPAIEFYMNNPHTTAEDDLITEIYVPLMPQ